MPRRTLVIFAAFLGVVWCFHATERKCTTSGSRTCSMKSESFAQNKIVPVIVTNNEPRSKDFLQYAASELNLNLKYVNIDEFDHSKLNDNSITIINAGVDASNKLDSLKLVQAVYLLTDDEKSASSAARSASKYDLYVSSTDVPEKAFANSARRLDHLLQKLRSPAASDADTLLDAGEWSHFVSLTFPSIEKAVPNLPALRIGADAFELRVDLLEDMSSVSIHRQIALLRDTVPLPIVYTVRSVGQIGKFPAEPERIFALLREGLRAGIEWMDVEACWPLDQTRAFTSLATEQYPLTSRILGSLHVTTPQTREQIDKLFADSSLEGKADILKVVTGAAGDSDCELIHEAGRATGKPYIGVCLGAAGSRSRVLNRRFTPVTHPLMATAAPGQLSAQQLMDARVKSGLAQGKNFYLFGTPIQHSLSPAMHNGAYGALLLPHKYSLSEQDSVDKYREVLADKSFGGASVTIPYKESIIPLIDDVRGAARKIGAVNTIVIEGGEKVGYNTDWLGIKRPVLRQLRKRGVPFSKTERGTKSIGLVIGAGGTAKAACYAVKDLGLDLVVCNRSPEKAEEVAKAFEGEAIALDKLSSLDPSSVQVVISTLPAQAGFTLPEELLQTAVKPVILDVVYKPARTKLIEQAMAHKCLFVQGATMLLEQGMEQFELWNKRRAPRDVMDAAVFNGVERLA